MIGFVGSQYGIRHLSNQIREGGKWIWIGEFLIKSRVFGVQAKGIHNLGCMEGLQSVISLGREGLVGRFIGRYIVYEFVLLQKPCIFQNLFLRCEFGIMDAICGRSGIFQKCLHGLLSREAVFVSDAIVHMIESW